MEKIMDMDKNSEFILDELKKVSRDGMSELIKFLEKSDFFIAPASTRFHSSLEGGLVDHSIKVYKLLCMKNKIYKRNIPEDTLRICGLLHDFTKINFYHTEKRWKKNEETNYKWESYEAYACNKGVSHLGHGEDSVIKIMEFIKLTDLEKAMIRYHMGFSIPFQMWNDLNECMAKYPDSVLMFTADIEASVLYEKG